MAKVTREHCQRVFLFALEILTSVQTFERVTFTEAALNYRDISTSEADLWKVLLFSGFGITTLMSPWLAVHIGVKSLARVGAVISLFVAFCLYMVDMSSKNNKQFIKLVQVLAPFAGMSDSMLAFSVLTAFINTTAPRSRGWNFGLLFVCISVAFVLGIDHKGVLSSLGVLETTDESSFTLVCFFSLTISFIALILISLINFEENGTGARAGGEDSVSYRWWRTLSMSGVRWSCFIVLVYGLILGYIKTEFVTEQEVNYGWGTNMVMNIELFAILGFLISCPLVGWCSDAYGSLRVMTTGNIALAAALLILGLVVEGVQGDQIMVGFVTTLFGICSAPSVVIALIHMHENMEVECASGSVTSSLYIISWLIGILLGLGLQYQIDNASFQEMAFECSGGEAVLGILAALLTSFNILRQPAVEDEFGKRLAKERLQKTPYVVQNNWEAI